MAEAKWEDLNQDCLVNIFGRLEMESLLLDIPFVCKSWHKSTRNPQCWRRLNFSCFDDSDFVLRIRNEYDEGTNLSGLIKSIVKRSDRFATSLELSDGCFTGEVLLYIANECPDLKTLLMPLSLESLPYLQVCIPNLVSKWKNLEFLRLQSCYLMQKILTQISIHCKNFVGLEVTRADIWEREASAIVTIVPHIKYLSLRYAYMNKKNLVMILQGCKELVHFDVRDCIGFDEGDDEILKLASHISMFNECGSNGYTDYDSLIYSDPYSDPSYDDVFFEINDDPTAYDIDELLDIDDGSVAYL